MYKILKMLPSKRDVNRLDVIKPLVSIQATDIFCVEFAMRIGGHAMMTQMLGQTAASMQIEEHLSRIHYSILQTGLENDMGPLQEFPEKWGSNNISTVRRLILLKLLKDEGTYDMLKERKESRATPPLPIEKAVLESLLAEHIALMINNGDECVDKDGSDIITASHARKGYSNGQSLRQRQKYAVEVDKNIRQTRNRDFGYEGLWKNVATEVGRDSERILRNRTEEGRNEREADGEESEDNSDESNSDESEDDGDESEDNSDESNSDESEDNSDENEDDGDENNSDESESDSDESESDGDEEDADSNEDESMYMSEYNDLLFHEDDTPLYEMEHERNRNDDNVDEVAVQENSASTDDNDNNSQNRNEKILLDELSDKGPASRTVRAMIAFNRQQTALHQDNESDLRQFMQDNAEYRRNILTRRLRERGNESSIRTQLEESSGKLHTAAVQTLLHACGPHPKEFPFDICTVNDDTEKLQDDEEPMEKPQLEDFVKFFDEDNHQALKELLEKAMETPNVQNTARKLAHFAKGLAILLEQPIAVQTRPLLKSLVVSITKTADDALKELIHQRPWRKLSGELATVAKEPGLVLARACIKEALVRVQVFMKMYGRQMQGREDSPPSFWRMRREILPWVAGALNYVMNIPKDPEWVTRVSVLHFQAETDKDKNLVILFSMPIDVRNSSMGRPLPLPKRVHPLAFFLVNSAPLWLGPHVRLFQDFRDRPVEKADSESDSDLEMEIEIEDDEGGPPLLTHG